MLSPSSWAAPVNGASIPTRQVALGRHPPAGAGGATGGAAAVRPGGSLARGGSVHATSAPDSTSRLTAHTGSLMEGDFGQAAHKMRDVRGAPGGER
jgi:hypothetical protein